MVKFVFFLKKGYKHLNYSLNAQDEFKVEMLISVSRSVLPSNGKHPSEIKKKEL